MVASILYNCHDQKTVLAIHNGAITGIALRVLQLVLQCVGVVLLPVTLRHSTTNNTHFGIIMMIVDMSSS